MCAACDLIDARFSCARRPKCWYNEAGNLSRQYEESDGSAPPSPSLRVSAWLRTNIPTIGGDLHFDDALLRAPNPITRFVGFKWGGVFICQRLSCGVIMKTGPKILKAVEHIVAMASGTVSSVRDLVSTRCVAPCAGHSCEPACPHLGLRVSRFAGDSAPRDYKSNSNSPCRFRSRS